jgi:hypothetical protein
MSLSVLKTIYYSSFNTIMSYDLILGGNSPHSSKIFRMQKKNNHDGRRSRVSCKNHFRKLGNFPSCMTVYFLTCVVRGQ